MKKQKTLLLALLGFVVYGVSIVLLITTHGLVAKVALFYAVMGGVGMVLLTEIWILGTVYGGDPEFWPRQASWKIKFACVAWSPVSIFATFLHIYPLKVA